MSDIHNLIDMAIVDEETGEILNQTRLDVPLGIYNKVKTLLSKYEVKDSDN